MDMRMQHYLLTKPKTNKSRIKRFLTRTIEGDEFKQRTIVNIENVRLLLADPDFVKWATAVREELGLPSNGLKEYSHKYEVWWGNVDRDLWKERLGEIHLRYTKINQAFMPYIASFVKFNNNFINEEIRPIQSAKISRAEIVFSKLAKRFGRFVKYPGINIEIYAPPTSKQWAKIIGEVAEHFEEFGIYTGRRSPKPTKDIRLKMAALSIKQSIDGAAFETDNYPRIETDQIVVERFFPRLSADEIKKLAKRLPRERELAKKLLVTRLGKTDIDSSGTKR